MDEVILERLAVIEAVLVRLETRLFGNGQPGEISALKKRVTRLESWLWRAMGGIAVLLGILEVLNYRLRLVK